MAELLDERPEPQVVRAKVVAPLGDAVGLVDDQQGGLGGAQAVERLGAAELLWSEKEELEVALVQVLQGLAPGALPLGRVDLGRLTGQVLGDVLDLVELQRDQ